MSVKRISDLPELKTVYGKTVHDGHLLSNELSNCLMEVSYVSEGKVYQSFYESLDVVLPDLDPVMLVSKGLQPATETALGGVKIGSNVCMNNDDQNVASILSVKTATTAVAGALKLPVDNTAYSVPDSQFGDIEFLGLKNGQLTAYKMPKISVDNPVNVSTLKDEMFDIMYPPGAIYTTTSNVLPTSFQGIWRRCHPGMMLWNCDAITSSNNYIDAAGNASDRAFGRILCQREPTISCQSAGKHTHDINRSSVNGSVNCFHYGSGYGGATGTGGWASGNQPIINGSVTLTLKNSDAHAHSIGFNYTSDSGANRSNGQNFMIRPESIGCSFWVRCNDNIISSIISDISANYQPGMSQADINNAYQIWLVEPTHTSTGNDRVQFKVYSRELENNGTMASKIKFIGEIKGSDPSNAEKWDLYMGVGYKDDVYHDLYSGDSQNIEEPYRPSQLNLLN